MSLRSCIYYHPDAYKTDGPKLMGRNAAGESFLRGYLRYAHSNEFWVQADKLEYAENFDAAVKLNGRSEPVKWVSRETVAALSNVNVVYHPGPALGQHAWQRSLFGSNAWSLCGITHTTSSAGAMDSIVDLLTAPVQQWDALICTSSAVKDNVIRVLQAQLDHLQHRLGATKFVLPQLPVIPLGIHAQAHTRKAHEKEKARASLGVDKTTLVVTYVGRLSFHAKAHPLAMYQALEMAAEATGKKVVLIECGWHANEYIKKAFSEAAKLVCPSVRVVELDGRQAGDRKIAWDAGDVFSSLSDNIQETFGITPIEAMAAGLPVVVSDWDGYKDTVRDGVDGFRIPTLMPQTGLGVDLAQRHALAVDTYDMYCGNTSSIIAVDIHAAASAFAKLFESEHLRQKMGDEGQRRARELYDWQVVIRQYETLWEQLSEIRSSAGKGEPFPSHPWPARMDPFHSFASYPTHCMTSETMLRLVDSDRQKAIERTLAYMNLAMVNFAKTVMLDETEIRCILKEASHEGRAARELVSKITKNRGQAALRALAWMVKIGVLRIA